MVLIYDSCDIFVVFEYDLYLCRKWNNQKKIQLLVILPSVRGLTLGKRATRGTPGVTLGKVGSLPSVGGLTLGKAWHICLV